jgi:peptide-methionine (S)-S-oxide reductase
MEAIFQELDGVLSVESGYSGGRVPDPTYEQVSTGSTGHAEVVEVTFDRTKISLADLLRIFFTLHDPTTPDRQGADVGTQYRSIIFTRNARQERTALDVRAEIRDRGVWPGNIVTEVVPFEAFWKAETSHQDYFANHGQAPYCRLVIEPKVLKLRELYRSRLRK